MNGASSMIHSHVQQQQAHFQAMAAVATTSMHSAPAGHLEDWESENQEFDQIHGMGLELQKLKLVIKSHVEKTELQNLFFDVSVDMDGDAIACLEAVKLLERIPKNQREGACQEIAKLLFDDKDIHKLEETDRFITKIFKKAHETKVISFIQACELFLLSTDFHMKLVPFDVSKFEYMADGLHELDYKGMRNLMKMVVEHFGKMPPHMTDVQRMQIVPLEQLFLDLIDRQKNSAPALFTITEITRMSHMSAGFLLPRIARKVTEIVASFRPLAEMTTMIGRTWMYPISSHINFNVNLQTWKLADSSSAKLYLKGHLPYNNETMAPQTYLQYVLLKQPRNQDHIPVLVRSSSSKLQCDDILPVLMLESMRAMETTEYALEADENQYTWRQIAHLFISCLYSGHAAFENILLKLHAMLKSHNFRVARAELMWVLLQFVAIRIDQLTEREMKGVEELYNLLYEDEPTWSGCGTDFHRMARFFGPAAIWVQFEKRAADGKTKVPPVPENLKGIVDQIQRQTTYANPGFIDALVAVAGNASTSNDKVFQERVIDVIRPTLDTVTSEEPWLLPFHRRATCRINSLDIQLLDAFTFRAKDTLFRYLLDTLTAFATNPGTRLPSPACIDTLVRIALTLEYQFGLSPIHRMLFPPKHVTNVDLLYMVTEMLNYRLVGCRMPVNSRCALVHHVYALMGQVLIPNSSMVASIPSSPNGSSRHSWPLNQLYMAFEQLIMRHTLWVPPNELAPFNAALVTVRSNDSGAFACALAHPECFLLHNTDPQGPSSWICPEITRMIALSVARTIKIVGDQINTEFVTLLQGQKFGSSTLAWFPPALLSCLEKQPNDPVQEDPTDLERIQNARNAYQHYMGTQDAQQRYDFLVHQCGKSQFSGFVVIFLTLSESAYGSGNYQQPMNRNAHIPCFYRFLEHLNSKEYIANVNVLVDFVIHWLSTSTTTSMDDRFLVNITSTINEMVFVYGMIPFERLLLSMVMHPYEKNAIRCSLAVIHTLLTNSKELQNRLTFLTQNLGQFHSTVLMKSEHHFMKLAEYYNSGFLGSSNHSYNDQCRHMSGNHPHHHGQENMGDPNDHYLPVYYGNLASNILPIVDALFQRSLEVDVDSTNLAIFLQSFSPCYKFHPHPANFVYSTLFCLDDVIHTNQARQFVLAIIGCSEDNKQSRDREQLLTSLFIKDNHQTPQPTDFCEQLVTRVVQACVYVHTPPSFIARDWRFSEHNPSGQALIGACIELMASPHNSVVIGGALVDIALRGLPIGKPYDVVNAVALILTALPHSFHVALWERMRQVVCSEELRNADPGSACFDPFSDQIFLYGENRFISMIALVHAYWQHVGPGTMGDLLDFLRGKVTDAVETETQLLFVWRLIVPFLQKLQDTKERARSIQDLVLSMYKMVGKVTELRGDQPLQYEDTICDVFYHAKYMFVGDAIRSDIEQTFQHLSPSMQEKLKFINSGQSYEHHTSNATMLAPMPSTCDGSSSLSFSSSSDVTTSLPFPKLLTQQTHNIPNLQSSSEPPSLVPVTSVQGPGMMPPATSMPMIHPVTMMPPSTMFQSVSNQQSAAMMMNPNAGMGNGMMIPSMMGFPGSGHHSSH